MILAIFQGARIYEGNSFSLNALYPMPTLSHVIPDPITEALPEFLGNVNPIVPPLFREDSFDPTTRIRRGRFYTPDSPNRRVWPVERVSHFPYGPPTGGQPAQYDMDVYSSLQPLAAQKSQVFLGGVNNRTAWRVVDSERLFNNETLFTLKSAKTFGVLPELIDDKLPKEKRREIVQGAERVADSAYNYWPQPIVDGCREFACVIVDAWLPNVLPTVAQKQEGKDLAKLIEVIPEEYKCVMSAATIINRLHSRGKSSAQKRQAQKGRNIRDVSNEDGELSLSLAGFLLREFNWAR